MSKPCASIVIPTYHNVALTMACLTSLVEHTGRDDYEVIIVDNASTDGTGELLDSLEGDVTVIRNPTNLGFAKACNQGAAAASADVVVFLNNDTEAHPGWLTPLLDVFARRPEVGAAGCRLLFPDGLVQHAGVLLVENHVTGYLLSAAHSHYRVARDAPQVLVRRDLDVVTAACVAVRRSAFEQVGGFDEGYWNGYEDVDLCLALGAAGWTVTYEPASVLTHHESVSGPERFSKVTANERRLVDKWLGRVVPDVQVTPEGVVRPHPARQSRDARREWQRAMARQRTTRSG